MKEEVDIVMNEIDLSNRRHSSSTGRHEHVNSNGSDYSLIGMSDVTSQNDPISVGALIYQFAIRTITRATFAFEDPSDPKIDEFHSYD